MGETILLQQPTPCLGFLLQRRYGPTRSLKMRHTFSKETREGSLGFFSGPRWEVIFFWLTRQPSVPLCFTTSIPRGGQERQPQAGMVQGMDALGFSRDLQCFYLPNTLARCTFQIQ